ncbi:MAG TPA: c-type cytochrome [Myxococcota bacterium]|nr:c-type cytochrome [Myxococcota bacterium]
MPRSLKPVIFAVCILGTVGAGASLSIEKLSVALAYRTFEVQASPVAVPRDAEALARGEHLLRITGCVDCHGEDLGGQVLLDDPGVVRVAAPNLTTGTGGSGATFTDTDFVRAIRYGVDRENRGLWWMPVATYGALTDADLGVIIGALGRRPPVDREVPRGRLGLGGRWRVALRQMELIPPHDAPLPVPGEPGTTATYGAYLARVTGCHGCHGPTLKGSGEGPDAPSDLTPASLGAWSEADFVRAMRDGRRPDDSAIDPESMPWRRYAQMTDLELRALWTFLHALPG